MRGTRILSRLESPLPKALSGNSGPLALAVDERRPLSATDVDEKFRVLCSAAFDGVVVHDGGTVVEANDKCAAMFGCDKANIIGRNILDFTAPEMRAMILAQIAAGSDRPYETIAVRTNGERFPVEVCGISVSGSSLRVVAIRDLSEQRNSQKLQRTGEERLRILARVAFDGICVHKDGKFVEVNESFARLTGYSEEELIGMPLEHLLPVEERANVRERIRSRDPSRFESCYLRKDGTTLPVEVCGTFLPSGERVAAIRDISSRRAAENEIRASEDRFRSIIENSLDLIAIIERDGKLRYHSPSIQLVLGITPESVVGRAFLDLVHPESVARVSQFLDRQIAEPTANGMVELRLQHLNGAWRSFEVVARNLTADGAVTAIVTNARDITDRKLLEAQLAQANRLSGLGRLAATVAHEFNNVLMGMQPFTELMQRPNVAPSMVTKGAWHIANSIQRGKRIALDILRFTQPAQAVTAVVDLGEWWEKFEPEAETVLGNVVRIVPKIRNRGVCVIADKEQLSQVMANLVANARDAMPAGGTLTVEASEPAADSVFAFGIVTNPEQFIHLSVADTGEGMTSEVMGHIFEPLFTTKKSGGTGLGLAVAHQVLTQHGGYIFTESEVNRGTTFHIFLPKGTGPCNEAYEVSAEPQKPEMLTLLMIEDEQPIVEGLSALLDCEGVKVVAVSTGGEATAAVARFRPDVVLLDFGLPDMDGSEVYARIRKLNPFLPIIFATGHGDRRAIHDVIADTRSRFLQKPFEVSTLLEMIAELQPKGSVR